LKKILCKNKELVLENRTLIMGILNITPDSFSDGGSFYKIEDALNYAKFLVDSGADILDIGGESTRPFSDFITLEQEIERVIPVIKKISNKISIPISIDTTKPEVAEEAINSGASIINDISGLNSNKNMLKVLSKYKPGLILMHMKGTPKNMQVEPNYEDLFEEINKYLSLSIQKALSSNLPKESIIIDPGIGFGKSIIDNLSLIRNIKKLLKFEYPIMIGSSRKFFIRKLLSYLSENSLSPKSEIVEIGTQASVAAASIFGASIVRVHDVKKAKATLRIIDAIKRV
jgi:dihydropteroate synthase